MMTGRIGPPRNPRASLVLGLLLACGAGPASAQRVDFNPSASLSWATTDNVAYVDPEGEGEDVDASDSITVLSVVLPASRPFRWGTIGLTYAGSRSMHSTFDELDNTSHSASASLGTKVKQTSLTAGVRFSRSQSQGNVLSPDDPGNLTNRVDRDAYGASLAWASTRNRRWSWNTSLDGTWTASQKIPGFDYGDPLLTPEDRTAYQGSAGVTRQISRRTNLGASYGYADYDLDTNADEKVHQLGVSAGFGFTEFFRVSLSVGGYTRSQSGGPPGETTNPQENGVNFGLSLDYDRTLKLGGMRLGFITGVKPSSGGSLSGTSTDTTVGVTLNRDVGRGPWGYGFGARYTRRESSNRTQPTIDTGALTAGVERSIGRKAGVRAGVSWARQSVDQPMSPTSSFVQSNAGLVWYPLERRRG